MSETAFYGKDLKFTKTFHGNITDRVNKMVLITKSYI